MEYFLTKLGLGEKRTTDHKLMASPTSGNCCDSLHWIWRTNIVIKLSFTNMYVNIYWTKFVSDLLCAAARMRTRMMVNIWQISVDGCRQHCHGWLNMGSQFFCSGHIVTCEPGTYGFWESANPLFWERLQLREFLRLSGTLCGTKTICEESWGRLTTSQVLLVRLIMTIG